LPLRRRGGEIVKGQRHHAVLAVAVLVFVCAAALLAVALAAPPARAFSAWQHDGAVGCVCHNSGTPTDATCTACHTGGFKSVPGNVCWSCHYPGQDTSTLSTPASACSQQCHLYSSVDKAYTIPFTHGSNPHLGSTGPGVTCLDCHQTSVAFNDPDGSPHHSGQPPQFTQCTVCHTGFQKHAGAVACTRCHTTAVAFHLYEASSPGFKQCKACHSMKHQGKKIALSKCAGCHKGSGPGPALVAQHSANVTKGYVCKLCHSQHVHASSRGSGLTCRSCHKGTYHAKQKLPGWSVCKRCHTAAAHHSNGFACGTCHLRAIHNAAPTASMVKPV